MPARQRQTGYRPQASPMLIETESRRSAAQHPVVDDALHAVDVITSGMQY